MQIFSDGQLISIKAIANTIRKPLGVVKRKLAEAVFTRLPLNSKAFGPPRGYYHTVEDFFANYDHKVDHNLGDQQSQFKPRIQRFEPETVSYAPPKTLETNPTWKFPQAITSTQLAPNAITYLPKGRILDESPGYYSVVISPDDKVILELSHISIPYLDKIFFAWRLPPVKRLPGSYVLVNRIVQPNFCHWLGDDVFRYILFKYCTDLSETDIDGYLVMGESGGFVTQTLDILNIPAAKRIYLKPGEHIECDNLIVPSEALHWKYPTWMIEAFRKEFLSALADDALEPKQERIFVSRENAKFRHITNREAVEEYLAGQGFTKVLLEELSLLEQVRTFHSASIIVAPHGAGLTNLLFCRPGTKVIEIFPREHVFFICFWQWASQVGLDYYYLLSKGDRLDDEGDWFKYCDKYADIDCDLDLLTATVEAALSEIESD